MPHRYTSPDMPQVTLLMLQRLDDFENYILTEESRLKALTAQKPDIPGHNDKAPQSSRVPAKVETQNVQLGNIKGCIAGLKNSIRMYRELWWKDRRSVTPPPGNKKTG
jgi:hypothetical protein